MPTEMLLVAYCGLVLLASLAGGLVPLLIRLTHRRLEFLVSFVSGVMLGAAFLEMLPHAMGVRAAEVNPSSAEEFARGVIEPLLWWVLAGLLAMFFIERFLCFHHHEAVGEAPAAHHPPGRHRHELSWTGAAIGLALHSLINGMALAASVQPGVGSSGSAGAAAPTEAARGAVAGLGVFLAIFLHKPFDSLTLGTLMAAGAQSRRARHLVNGAFGLAVPAGALLFVLGAGGVASSGGAVAPALAFSAGTFLCIALSDLLPELQFHQHDRVKLSAALLLGLAVAWAAGRLEALP